MVVPVSINLARDRLKIKGIKLPSNNDLYDILRNARLVDADEAGRSVRRIKVQGRQGNTVLLSALIFPADKVVPKLILPTLLRSHFEITTEPVPETAHGAEE